MLTPTARGLLLLCTAALAPIALGVAMHLEHVEAERACLATAQVTAPVVQSEVVTQVVPVHTPVLLPSVVSAPTESTRGAYDFAFVIEMPAPYLVLASAADLGEAQFDALAVNPPHYRGEPADDSIDQPVWRDLDVARLPERARLAVGRHVRVYSAAGRVCVARIGNPSLVSESFGTVAYLPDDEVSELEQDGRTILDPASLWDDGRRAVVAPLEGVGCEGGVWARDAALSEPLVYVAQDTADVDGLPSPVARRMVQRAPGLRPIITAFAEHVANFDDEVFTTRRLVDRLQGRRWIEPTRGRELDVFSLDGEEFGGCGGFDPAWAAIALDVDGSPTEPVWVDTQSDDVQAVFDLDGDGNAEVLAHSWLGPTRVFATTGGEQHATSQNASAGPNALREIASLGEVPFFGCPC